MMREEKMIPSFCIQVLCNYFIMEFRVKCYRVVVIILDPWSFGVAFNTTSCLLLPYTPTSLISVSFDFFGAQIAVLF